MRTIEVNLYEFEELSTEAKEKAIEKNRHINVDYDWYDWITEGMCEVGVKINSFDIYYKTIDITIEYSEDTALKAIENYNEGNGLVEISKKFIEDRDALIKKLGEGNDIAGYSVKDEFIDEYDEEIEYLKKQYRREVSEEILSWLIEDYEYLQTNDAIAETLIANEYEFTEDGAIY